MCLSVCKHSISRTPIVYLTCQADKTQKKPQISVMDEEVTQYNASKVIDYLPSEKEDEKLSGHYKSEKCDPISNHIQHSGDDYNALQCELISAKRTNDALVLENHKFRVELSEAYEQLASSQRLSEQTIEYLKNSLEKERAEREKERVENQKQNANKFDKIRSYALGLIKETKLRHQTRLSLLENKMHVQTKEAEKAKQYLENSWQKRMDEYRDQLTAQFNDLLWSVQKLQEERRMMEEKYARDLDIKQNIVDNLQIELRTWIDKYDAMEITLGNFKENNFLLRDKLSSKEDTIVDLTSTVKEGIKERKLLENKIKELQKKKKQSGEAPKSEDLAMRAVPKTFGTQIRLKNLPMLCVSKKPKVKEVSKMKISRTKSDASCSVGNYEEIGGGDLSTSEAQLESRVIDRTAKRGKSLSHLSGGKNPMSSGNSPVLHANGSRLNRRVNQQPRVWK